MADEQNQSQEKRYKTLREKVLYGNLFKDIIPAVSYPIIKPLSLIYKYASSRKATIGKVLGSIVVGSVFAVPTYFAWNSYQYQPSEKSVREKEYDGDLYTILTQENGETTIFLRENRFGKSLSKLEEEVKANALNAYKTKKENIEREYNKRLRNVNDTYESVKNKATKEAQKNWGWNLPPSPVNDDEETHFLELIQSLNDQYNKIISENTQ